MLAQSALQVFFGIPFKQGDIILTSQAEYGSNYLAYLQVTPLTYLQALALNPAMLQLALQGVSGISRIQARLGRQPSRRTKPHVEMFLAASATVLSMPSRVSSIALYHATALHKQQPPWSAV